MLKDGSVTSLTDADQNLIATYKYDVFGAVTASRELDID